MPSHPSLLPDFHTLVRWDADVVAPPIDLGKARLKELHALGHKVARFLVARGACLKQAAKGDHGTWPEWAAPAEPPPGELGGGGLFACAVLLGEAGFLLPQPILAPDMAGRLGQLWQRMDPDAPKALPPVLEVPADANAPIWLALLRLRAWREFWERELRRATLESLLHALPDAWVLDPTPLPPGAVIPRLELPSWSDLPRLRASGRRFVIASSQEMHGAVMLDAALPLDAWASAIGSSLEAFTTAPRVLVELPRGMEPPPTWVVVFYEKKADRTDSIGVMALSPDADAGLVPGRASMA